MKLRGPFSGTVPADLQPRYSSAAHHQVKLKLQAYGEQGLLHPHFGQLKFGHHRENLEALSQGRIYGVPSDKPLIAELPMVRPVTASLVVTNECGLRCRRCPYQDERTPDKRESEAKTGLPVIRPDRQFMDLDLAKHVLGELRTAGIKGVIFTGGGEPFFHRSLYEIMLLAKRYGFKLGLFTNGVLPNQDLLRQVVTDLSPELQFIRISLNACDGETYIDFHRTTSSSYRKVCGNIMFLARLKYQNVFPGSFGLGFIVGPNNLESFWHLLEMIEGFTLEMGRQVGSIDYAALRPEVNYKRTANPASLPAAAGLPEQQPKETHDYLRFIHSRLRHTFGQRLRRLPDFRVFSIDERFEALHFPQQEQSKLCVAHPWRTAVWYDGSIYVCDEHNGEEGFSFGSLRNHNWKELWAGEQRKDVIAALNRDYFQSKCPPICVLSFLNILFYQMLQLNDQQSRRILETITQMIAKVPPKDVNFL